MVPHFFVEINGKLQGFPKSKAVTNRLCYDARQFEKGGSLGHTPNLNKFHVPALAFSLRYVIQMCRRCRYGFFVEDCHKP